MKILITDKILEIGVVLLQKEHEVHTMYNLDKEELIKVIPSYDAILVRSGTRVTKDVIEAGINLKVIGRAGVGVDNIDVKAATDKGIIVVNSPNGNTIATTEYTMAMLLSLSRNLPQAYNSMKLGKWNRSEFLGVELQGKTLGVIGFGRIGSEVAKRAAGFNMKVLAYDPFISEESAEDAGVDLVDLERIYADADFITIHTPLTAETRYMVNQEAFAKMKPGVRIIQCARGGIVDEDALIDALDKGIVAGAAIDVFENEPLNQNHKLLEFENVIVTPHLGASTQEAQKMVAISVAEGILSALRGDPVTSAANMPPVPPRVIQLIKPYLHLAEKMGTLAINLSEGRLDTLEICYTGEIGEVDSKILTYAIIKGILNPILQEAVNYVNAYSVAKLRGIKIREVKSKDGENFANLISVKVRTDKGEHRVAGTLFGRQEGRIVMIDGYRVDVEPKGWLLIIPHSDSPGMVGKVGSLLGENSINITGMQVGRTEQEGTNIMVVSVQQEIPAPVLSNLKQAEGILGAKLIYFNGTN
ncbi:MAG: phosphoglycerate dehydrogenase [Desulfitobacterium hafniense]|nr:phosphoglycerate dehydrogenase [Desulfitobacterium hafniense]